MILNFIIQISQLVIDSISVFSLIQLLLLQFTVFFRFNLILFLPSSSSLFSFSFSFCNLKKKNKSFLLEIYFNKITLIYWHFFHNANETNSKEQNKKKETTTYDETNNISPQLYCVYACVLYIHTHTHIRIHIYLINILICLQ